MPRACGDLHSLVGLAADLRRLQRPISRIGRRGRDLRHGPRCPSRKARRAAERNRGPYSVGSAHSSNFRGSWIGQEDRRRDRPSCARAGAGASWIGVRDSFTRLGGGSMQQAFGQCVAPAGSDGATRAAIGSCPAGTMLKRGSQPLARIILLACISAGAGTWSAPASDAAGSVLRGITMIMGWRRGHARRRLDALNQLLWLGRPRPIGFSLRQMTCLIVVGALVGSSRCDPPSYIMCIGDETRQLRQRDPRRFGGATGEQQANRGRNRSPSTPTVGRHGIERRRTAVVIVPGYGMAVAQARQGGRGTDPKLRAAGKEVRFCHPPGCRAAFRVTLTCFWPRLRCPTTSCSRWTRSTRISLLDRRG